MDVLQSFGYNLRLMKGRVLCMPYQHIENDVQLITAKTIADSTHLALAFRVKENG